MKKVHVIVVALDAQNFTHYLMEPKVFYETKEEAQEQINRLISNKEYTHKQLNIFTLWKQNNNS